MTEWAASGSASLKADLTLGSRQATLRLTQDRSLSGGRLQARVKHAAWGSFGSGLTAKLYVKTGSGWAWYDGGALAINSSSATLLTLNLSGVANLSTVREIGVEFSAPANSSGGTAIYVDSVTLAP